MPPTETELNEFNIIGISVRTTNQNGQSQSNIGALWSKFMGQGWLKKIPNKATDDIYCIYTDYESDFNGQYTTILGCKVTSLDHIPSGLIGKTIPSSKYLVFKSNGKLPDCIVETWKNIWQSVTNRKYIADFDVYGQEAQNSENASVNTFVSIQ